MKIKLSIRNVSLLVPVILTSALAYSYNVIPGTIQFPAITRLPTIRIYCGGKIIPCIVNQKNKTITFTIPHRTGQEEFCLLITESIDFARYSSKYEPGNTAAYIKFKDGQPYLFFILTRTSRYTENKDKNDAGSTTYSWHITEIRNSDKNNRIPDEAIIVCLPSNWVQSVTNTRAFELPTINIRQDILTINGSEKSFYDLATKLQLAALDTDTLHSPCQEAIKQEQGRIILAAPTA